MKLYELGDYVSDEIRRTHDYFEAPILAELKRRVTSRGVIVDVGAHIGNHSVYFAQNLPYSQIHAFEPWPANLELLRHNLAMWPEVYIHPHALSDQAGSVHMLADANPGHIRLGADGPTVEAFTLDAFRFRDVTLLKIDVEGHEPQVLAGARETIAQSHPLILIEDWGEKYGPLLPGYQLVKEWAEAHQTYLYEWAP